MLICTVKPSAVAVVRPNVGVNAAASEVTADVVSEPLSYPVRVVVIVAIELVPGATPVMVAKPVLPEPVTTTEPDAVAVPAQV